MVDSDRERISLGIKQLEKDLVAEYMTNPNHSAHNLYVRPETNLLIISYYADGTRILDISDPRAVEETIMELPGIKLLFRDQVAEIYEENAKLRAGIVPAVEKIIDKELPILSASMKRA